MELISHLVEEARRFAQSADVPLVVERSVSSEAVYLKAQRGGYWYGIRIAAHRPAHLSSADCGQILVDRTTTLSDELLATLREAIASGGNIVADPAEVREEILKAHLRRPGEAGFRPLPSAAEISALRHRLNLRAQWCHDEETRDRL